jgi:hypothetical protein
MDFEERLPVGKRYSSNVLVLEWVLGSNLCRIVTSPFLPLGASHKSPRRTQNFIDSLLTVPQYLVL